MNEAVESRRASSRRSRRRLSELAARMTEAHAALQLEDGWTIAATLAHIGVWDRFSVARWEATPHGVVPDRVPQGVVDAVNAATLPLLARLPLQAAIEFAEQAAADFEATMETLPLEALVEANGTRRSNLIDRSTHRLEHMSAIERALDERDGG